MFPDGIRDNEDFAIERRRSEIIARCRALLRMGLVDDFRNFLSDEEEDDDVFIAQEIHHTLASFPTLPSQKERELFIRFLSESAVAMSDIELDELKRFAAEVHFSYHEYGLLERERREIVCRLRDSIRAAEELHIPSSEEDLSTKEGVAQKNIHDQYALLLETLAFDESATKLQDIYRVSLGARRPLSPREVAQVQEILLQEKSPYYRGVLLARGLQFYDLESPTLHKERELRRITSLERVAVDEDALEEENILLALDALLSGKRFYGSYEFWNFFPGKASVKTDRVAELFMCVCDALYSRLPARLREMQREEVESRVSPYQYHLLFKGVSHFMEALLRQTSLSDEERLRKKFLQVLTEQGGEKYREWVVLNDRIRRELEQETETEQPSLPSVSSKTVPIPVPLVVASQSLDVHSRSLKKSELQESASKADVLARLEAGGLLHLSEEIRLHSLRFAALVKDRDVQDAARVAIERMLRAGNFGVAERAGSVFFGENWRTARDDFRATVRDYILHERAAHFFVPSGARLPISVLRTKAEAFGISWSDLEREAARLKPPSKRKKKM